MTESTWARRYYWSLRRELWEHPSIYVAPLAAGALAVLAYLVSSVRPVGQTQMGTVVLGQPFDFASGLVMFSTIAVGVFYSLDTLYGERRDRSILFWKSLPVSDATTVAAKVTVPLVILPLVTTAVAVLALTVMIITGSLLTGSAHPPLVRSAVLLLYHMFTVHALWWAPFFGWMLLISAWARGAPLVWAVVPVLAISFAERIALNTTYFTGMLQSRINFSPEAVVAKGSMPIDPSTHMTAGLFLQSPGLWVGLAIMLAFAVLAARRRRSNGPI
jgi:ABC-2 type transport system permease protein